MKPKPKKKKTSTRQVAKRLRTTALEHATTTAFQHDTGKDATNRKPVPVRASRLVWPWRAINCVAAKNICVAVLFPRCSYVRLDDGPISVAWGMGGNI